MPVEMNERFTSRCIALSFPTSTLIRSLTMKKLKFALAAYAAALALGVSAQAATLDVKTAANPVQAKMQVDAEKATGNIFTAKYRGHEGVDQMQATNGYQYGAGMLKAKWVETTEVVKPVLIVDAKKPFAHAEVAVTYGYGAGLAVLVNTSAAKKAPAADKMSKLFADAVDDKVPAHVKAAASDKTGFNRMGQTVAKSSTLQQADGLTIAGATDPNRAGLTLGHAFG